MATDDLRASDAERDHVIDLLQRAVGQGMLDLDEFSERTDAVLSASTRSEVNAVLLDLPDLVPDEPRTTKADVLVLRSMLSEVTRSGRWHVPNRVLITSRLGVTRLDFTQAVLAGQFYMPLLLHQFDDAQGVDIGLGRELHHGLGIAGIDLDYAQGFGGQAQSMGGEQGLGGFGQLAVAVYQFFLDGDERIAVARMRKLFV